MGLYELPRRSGEAHLYRLGHLLAQRILEQAKSRSLPPAEVVFDYSKHEGKVSILEEFIGKSGKLSLSLFTVESLDQAEDYLILAGLTDGGEVMEEETLRRILSLPAQVVRELYEWHGDAKIEESIWNRQEAIQRLISRRNAEYFEAEAEKLDCWADDLKVGLEREIKEIDRQIKEVRRVSIVASTLEEKLAGQRQIKVLEAHRNTKRRSLFDAQDEIDKKREELIKLIESKLRQKATPCELFSIKWNLV